MFQCDINDAPVIGILGIVSHRAKVAAKDMYSVFARQTDPADQRVMRLALTEKGRSCIQSIKDVTDKMEEILLKGMSVEEKILFRRLLVHVNNNIDQYERKEKI